MKIEFEIEPLPIEHVEKKERVVLEKLTPEEVQIIDPIIPPTSGIRIAVCDHINKVYRMLVRRQMMMLRVFQAVADIAQKEIKKSHIKVLIVADDRPSSNKLTEYCAKVFSHSGYEIYFQKNPLTNDKTTQQIDQYYSRMSTPYASASIKLFPEIDLVVAITASHNELIWNGIKIYIERPIPISGTVMESISKRALEYSEIIMDAEINPHYLDANAVNNEYVVKLVNQIIDTSILRGKKIILWPYLGSAPEIQDLLHKVGAEVILIDENIEPPNPTAYMDIPKTKSIMEQHDSSIAILLDADRDRVVFLIRDKQNDSIYSLTPNELYTAMHNLLATKFKKKIINVRTVPSDPRSDKSALINIMAGVGYKHLGMVLYSALHKIKDPAKIATGLIYLETEQGYEKVTDPHQIPQFFAKKGIIGDDLIMVLWEESGGHTFNLLKIEPNGPDDVKVQALMPELGDKYPAPAILVLCTLLEMGYNLPASVDRNVVGTRTVIEAQDERKVRIVQGFAKLCCQEIQIGNESYQISTLEQVDGVVDIIVLSNPTTKIYFRPSGTGPEVRIYIFAPASLAKKQLELVKQKIDEMFP
jgi:phosphomannomutase